MALEVHTILQTVELLDKRTQRIKERQVALVLSLEAGTYLLSIKGIGPLTAAGILAEIGDISQYRMAYSALFPYGPYSIIPGEEKILGRATQTLPGS